MKIKKLTTFLILIIFVFNFFIISTTGNDEESDILLIIGENIDEDTIRITTEFPELKYSKRTLGEDDFTYLDINDCGFQYYEGKAKLPNLGRMIEIPQKADPVIIINDIKWEYVSLNDINMPMKIYPVQPSQPKKENQDNIYTIDQDYYNTNEFLPQEPIIIKEIKEIRGRRFAIIQISPVQYNPVLSILKIMDSCDLTINLLNSDILKTIENIERYSSTPFEELYDSIFLNYGFYENMAIGNRDPEGLLIIADDAFSDEIAPLASHKTTLGFDTTTTLTSDIPGGPTAQNIKDYIQDAYDTWAIPPSYVLLVGDTPQIPAFTGSVCYTETDSYYGRMDGDIFPDIYIGRFPAGTEAHVITMVDKTIYYEEGDFPSNDWIKKGAFIASDDAGLTAEYTHDYVIDTHLEPNGYTCDKIYERLGGSTQDITNALNEGRSLCIYSGHGSPSGWGCVPFYQSNVNALTNAGMYPFVCSHACSTSTYEGTSECFGETWLRAENKGGLSFWGSSCSTYWPEDDVIERRVFDAWWYDGMERIGQMTDKGMYDAYVQNPGLNIEKFMESYNVLGDASVKIWSDDPFTPDYDIQLESISIDDIVPHNETQTVTAVVRNVGLFEVYGVVVNFKENGIVINTTTISYLDSMQNTLISFDWDPTIGTFLIEIESQPIPNEYDLTNNNVNKTVEVIAAPAIDVDPNLLSFMVPTDATDTDNITIYNLPNAEASLNYAINFSGDLNGNWLSANPDNGTIHVGFSEDVIINVNTTGLNEGEYHGNIIIDSNDLNDAEVIIPVNLTVVFGNDLVAVDINYPVGVIPHGSHIVNATIQNLGFYDQTDVDILCSIYEGFIDYNEDFELDNGSYIEGGDPNWEWGNPTSGPSNAYSGINCWATNLDGDYTDEASSTLDSIPIYLPDGISSELSFWHWYNIEDGVGHYDGGNVKISYDGGTYWQVIGEYLNPYPIEYASDANEGIPHEPCFSGSTTGWEYVTIDLSDFSGEIVQFRWHFGSDGSVNYDGWYIDDVSVSIDYGKDRDTPVYYSIETIDINAYDQQYVEFTPAWNANENNFYTIQIKTLLTNDENNDNNASADIVEVFEDLTAPDVTDVSVYPNPQIIDGFVNISCTVTDETVIGGAFVDISGPIGFIPFNVSMNNDNSDTYYYYTNYSVEGIYDFEIYTFDTSSNSILYSGYSFEIVNNSYISADIPMEAGWNLISIPAQTNWWASDIAGNLTGCSSISNWDAMNQTYKTYIVGGPPTFDFIIESGCGYFVDMTGSDTLIVVGYPIISVNIPLKIGWNLLGWYQDYDTTASSLSENVTGCTSISMWNASLQTYDTYIVGGPPTFDFIINRGKGLFADVTQESIWYGEG